MKVISFINLKGGVGKTTTAINMGYILSAIHNKRVLLVDNDKQGNLSKFFCMINMAENKNIEGISELLLDTNLDIKKVIQTTGMGGLDIILSNMDLLGTMQEILEDNTRPQHTRLKDALEQVKDEYDYCIIDNPPDINISVINALIATDDVIVPTRADYFSFMGIKEILEQIEAVREYNPGINFKGCLLTMYQKNNVNRQAREVLSGTYQYPVFETVIRNSIKVSETTYAGATLQQYAKKCTAAQDYIALVEEYLK